MTKRIVLWSFDSDAVGSILPSTKNLEASEARGEVSTLPVEELFVDSPDAPAIGGFFRRDFGRTGPTFLEMRPTRAASVLLWVVPDFGALHYAVRVEQVGKGRPRGLVRISPGPNALGAFTGGIGAVGQDEIDLDAIANPKPGEGWILKGRARFSAQIAGYASFCLQAVADGVRVAWVAASQSSAER